MGPFDYGRQTLIDVDGGRLFASDFDNVETYCGGRAKVQAHSGVGRGLKTYEGGNYGLIDKQGRFVVDPVYENLFDWYDGFIVVVRNGLHGTIDESGKVSIPPTHNDLSVISVEDSEHKNTC